MSNRSKSVSPEDTSSPNRDSWIRPDTTPTRAKSPQHTSTSRYNREKHSVPGRNVFDLLAEHHETNPTPRKPKKASITLSPWEQLQEKLIIKWLNSQIGKRGMKVSNLREDIKDGVILINLIEILSGKLITRKYKKQTAHRLQQLDNMEVVMETIKEEGVKLVSTNPSDVVDGNVKLILGLLTALIHHYHIKVTTSEKSITTSNRAALLEWLKIALPDHNIANLSTSWNDGLVLSALVNYCMPGLIPNHASLDPNNRLENVRNAMEIAEKELGVPQIIDPEDLATDKPEEFMVMVYLAYFCNPQLSGQERLLEWVNTFLPSKRVSDFGSCWEDGRILYELVQAIFPRAVTPLDMLEDQSPTKLKHLAKDIAERELDINAPKSLTIATGEDFELTLIMFLGQLQAKVSSPIPSETLTAEGTGIRGTNVKEDALINIVGDVPSSDNLTVVVTEPSGLLLYVEECSPASYQYTPTEHGEHTVDITFYGRPIAGSPYRVVHIDKSLITKCKVAGQTQKGCVNTPVNFIVDCSEAGVGEVRVVVESDEGDNIPVTVSQTINNKHEVTFTPTSIGEYRLQITWNGEALPSSPYNCQVIDPSRCEASGAGLSKSIIGRPSCFHITTTGAGNGTPSATVSGPSEPVELVLLSSDDGTYTYKYTPVQKGSYHIDVKFDGYPLHGSPFIVRPESPTIASACSVQEFPRTSMPTNKPINILVRVDELDSNAELVGTFILEESEDNEAQCNVTEVSKENNFYQISFVPTKVGVYTVHIQYGGLEIPECPLNFAVNDPSQCTVDSNPGEVHHIDKLVCFKVGTENAGYGVLTAKGDDPTGKSFELKVAEDSEELDRYAVSFVPKQGGKHLITLLFDNQPLADMPLCIQVESNTLNNIVLSKPVGQHGHFLVNELVSYKMFAPGRKESLFEVSSLGVNTGAIPKVTMEPVGEDSFNITFKGGHPDEYKVSISYNGQQIPGSPFTVNVTKPPQPEQVISFDPVIPLEAGKPIELTFDASVAGGIGSGTLTANIYSTSNSWIIPTVSQISMGLFRISFVPPKEDRYTVTVYWYGNQVKDSPFIINFKPQVKPPKVLIEFEPNPSERRLLTANAIGRNTKQDLKVNVQQYERGKYQLSLTPVIGDVYDVYVFWCNQEIRGSPFALNLQRAAPASTGIKEISALVVGEKSGPRKATMTVSKKKDVATITFDDRKRDAYNLFVYINKCLVKGAPFKLDVSN